MGELTHVIVEEENKPYYYYPAPTEKGERIVLAGMVSENKLYIGMSICSLKDIFDKKKGRAIALGRAEKTANIPLAVEELKKYLHNLELVRNARELTPDESKEIDEVKEKIANPKQYAVKVVEITDSAEPVGRLFVKTIEEDGRWKKRPETEASIRRKERQRLKREAKRAKATQEVTP